jgi:hypothetical protein
MVAPLIRRAYGALPAPLQEAVKGVAKSRLDRLRAIRVLRDSMRPGSCIDGVMPAVTTDDPPPGDEPLTARLTAAYRRSAESQALAQGSMWSDFFEAYHRPLHDAFIGPDPGRAAALLRHPAGNDLFYGFDFLCAEFLKNATSAGWRNANAASVADALLRLAEVLGAVRLPNRERQSTGFEPVHRHELDDVLAQVEAALGRQINLPTPFAGEHGMATPRGVMSYRVPQALYQAHRIRQLTQGVAHPAVLEIGGGLGRTAFYARELGIRDYTIIDLPLTSIAQGSFLGRTLGGDAIRLAGEDGAGDDQRIKLLSPDAFLHGTRRYDLVLNADSLTEMGEEIARGYLAACLPRASTLLSINHESNGFTVNALLRGLGVARPIIRSLYPMRDGYVEEVVRLGDEDGPP